MQTVLIGCKLPNGIVLELVNDALEVIKKQGIDGLNKIKIIGATYASTPVEVGFWEAWVKQNLDNMALKSGALFVAKDERDLSAKAKDLSKEKTGFDKLTPNDKTNKVETREDD